jgi:hypothetical protein
VSVRPDFARSVTDIGQDTLFDAETSWQPYWWGMPEYISDDLRPARTLTMWFASDSDYEEFRRTLDLKLASHQHQTWWPQKRPRLKPLEYFWRGKPSPTRYPVYIPSKGRAQYATTPRLLDQAGVDYWLVVECTEADAYRERFGEDRVLVLPFHNLGQGSIPARNYIWGHAATSGAPWHWMIDDNIGGFFRHQHNRRLSVKESSAPMRMVEDFVDRYDNLAMAGLHGSWLMSDDKRVPLTLNTRIYSVTLLNTALPHRWRGKYNEDTDLCLRVLKDGWATALFKNMLYHKAGVTRGDGSSGMPGGNTDTVYAVNDYRLAFAQSLAEQHPDCVEVTWRFNRWHHKVDYSRFSRNRLDLRPSVVPVNESPDYGLSLVRSDDERTLEAIAPNTP